MDSDLNFVHIYPSTLFDNTEKEYVCNASEHIAIPMFNFSIIITGNLPFTKVSLPTTNGAKKLC